MAIHRIRLRQSWKATPITWSRQHPGLKNLESLPSPANANAGELWTKQFGDFVGTVRYERIFHPPTNLSENECVFLVFESFVGDAEIFFGAERLGNFSDTETPLRFDITKRLEPNCRLRVDLNSGCIVGGLTGGVWLEIEA